MKLTNKVRKIIEENTAYKMFPIEILTDIIPEICNDTNRIGNFSFFNAFFMDDYLP